MNHKHKKIDKDYLAFCNPQKVGECCYKTISTIQVFDEKTQVIALATMFLMLIEVHDIRLSEIMSIVENMMKREFKEVSEFRGTYDYLWNEINK